MVYIQGQIDLHASQQKEQAQELMEAQVRHTQLQERIGELERKRTTGFDGNSMIDRLADLYARYEELQRGESSDCRYGKPGSSNSRRS